MSFHPPNNPHCNAISVHPTLAYNNGSTIEHACLFRILMKDGLRVSHFGVAIAGTDEQRLWAGLQTPKREGEGSGRARLRCQDAIDGEDGQ